MSYVTAYFHCVFSTKERRPFINRELRQRLLPFLGGIARQNGFKLVCANAVADHVHALISLPATMPVAKAVQLLKGGSSKWIHETFADQRLFSWQAEYGAFSVSVSSLQNVTAYIADQENHHRTVSFRDEFFALLRRHGVPFDERFLP